MSDLRSKLLTFQYVAICMAYAGATLLHEEAALVGFLTVPLIALKLAGVIVWSWIWVLSPIWGVVFAGALVVLGTYAYVQSVYWSEHRTRNERTQRS